MWRLIPVTVTRKWIEEAYQINKQINVKDMKQALKTYLTMQALD